MTIKLHDLCTAVERCGVGGQGQVLASTSTLRPKQSRKRFNCITKTIHFAHLSILFTYGLHPEQAPGLIISPKKNGSISDPKSPLKIN